MVDKIREKYSKNFVRYTEEEASYIAENWGTKSLTALSKKLGRSPSALIRYAENHGLGGAYVVCNDLLSIQEAADVLGVNYTTIRRHWMKDLKFPARMRRYNERGVYRVNVDDLLKWCENHQDKFTTEHMELFALGKEPDWLTLKRKKDAKKSPVQKMWDLESEELLLKYIMRGYTNTQIADLMKRTKNSISRKKCRLIEAGRLKEYATRTDKIFKVSC